MSTAPGFGQARIQCHSVGAGTYTFLMAELGLHYAIFSAGQTTGPVALADIDLVPHDSNSNNNTGTYTLAASAICSVVSGATAPQLVRLQDAVPFTFTGTSADTVSLRVINLVPDLSGGATLANNGAAVHGSDDAGTSNVPYAGTSGFDSSHYNSGINLSGRTQLTIRTNGNAVLANVPHILNSEPCLHAIRGRRGESHGRRSADHSSVFPGLLIPIGSEAELFTNI